MLEAGETETELLGMLPDDEAAGPSSSSSSPRQMQFLQEHTDSESDSEQVVRKEDEDPTFSYFARPHQGGLELFFKHQPCQTSFNTVLNKAFFRKDGTNRKWLSYCEKTNSLFCTVCLAFSKSDSLFANGLKNKKQFLQNRLRSTLS